MQAIEFPQQTFILAKDQPEYIPLPVHAKMMQARFKDEDGKVYVRDIIEELTACFKLSPEEIDQVVATGKFWYTQCVWGQDFQPIRMSVLNPFEEAPEALQRPTREAPRNESDIVSDFINLLKTQSGIRSQLQGAIAREVFTTGLELTGDDDCVFEVSEYVLNKLATMCALNFIHKLCGDHEALNTPVSSPAEPLKKALVSDPAYREGWRANLAAAYMNRYKKMWPNEINTYPNGVDVIEIIANEAADNFLNQLCNDKPGEDGK